MRNATADVTVAHDTGTRPGMMRVGTKIKGIEIDITMRKESMTLTHSRDTNNRGRTSITTSRSEEHLAVQATFDYCDVRIKDQQAAKSDYSDLLGCSGGNGCASGDTGHRYGTNFTSKVQVFNSTPPSRNPPPSTDPPAKARETTIMMTITNMARRTNINPIPTYQLEQRTKIGMLS